MLVTLFVAFVRFLVSGLQSILVTGPLTFGLIGIYNNISTPILKQASLYSLITCTIIFSILLTVDVANPHSFRKLVLGFWETRLSLISYSLFTVLFGILSLVAKVTSDIKMERVLIACTIILAFYSFLSLVFNVLKNKRLIKGEQFNLSFSNGRKNFSDETLGTDLY